MTDVESKLNIELESLFEDPPTDLPYSVNYWFHKDYPKSPPKITFKTRIYNCNIDPNKGTVCVSLLKNWKIEDPKHGDYFPPKSKNIREALFAVSLLFYEQNPTSTLNKKAAELYKKEDKTDFINNVKE